MAPPKFVSLNIYLQKFVPEGVTEAAVRQAGMEGGGGGAPFPKICPKTKKKIIMAPKGATVETGC